MKTQPNNKQLTPYNQAVKSAYFKLLKETTKAIATIERDELRYTLQRENNGPIAFCTKVHEIISPIIYLSLECAESDRLSIHFGIEQMNGSVEYAHITANFLRMLYKFTSSEHTTVNIEDCINTDYVITCCSDLFEAVEDLNKTHTLIVIKFKSASNRRKQMRAVA